MKDFFIGNNTNDIVLTNPEPVEEVFVSSGCSGTYSCDTGCLSKENFLGEFITEYDKVRARHNLGIADEYTLRWENIKGDITKSEALIQLIQQYSGTKPSTFSMDLDMTITMGLDQVASANVVWSYNQDITRQYVNNTIVPLANRSVQLTGPFSPTITLKAEHGKDESTKSISINEVYYGIGEDTVELPTLQYTKKSSILVDPGEGYIFILVPRLKTPTFVVNNFAGGFELMWSDVLLDIWPGVPPMLYNIYRSDYPNLGNTKIDIKWELS